ncbi:hypothetical protein BYT27DRAFT_7261619 [Phlegmacium glaucopus]|nr:hypothetical protein BYT27DRAFT_7261619 [Phlegmacium glaucopus]
MPWSEGVVEQFEIVDLYTTDESELYGPFNSLLVELFPSSEHYQVSPQFKRINGSLDFTVQFIVHRRRIPILFLEVETFRSLMLLSARGSADDQMRQRFRELASATRSIDPPAIARDLVMVNDIAPEARWAYNLLELAGEAKFREVVNAVKGMTAGL